MTIARQRCGARKAAHYLTRRPCFQGDGDSDLMQSQQIIPARDIGSVAMLKLLHRPPQKVLMGGLCAFSPFGPTASFAADADNGKPLANRWCSSCHLVEHDQKL